MHLASAKVALQEDGGSGLGGGYAETRRVREAAIIEHAGSLEPLGPGLFPPQRLCPNNSATNKAFQR